MTWAGAGDRAALVRLLGVPEMGWLIHRVRSRILAAQGAPLSGVVRLDDPSGDQRAAVVKLVGPPKRRGTALRVDLADVEQILRRGPWPAGLADAVETLSGPVVDRRAERAWEDDEWDRARRGLDPAIQRFPALGAWWESWCATGGLKKSTRAEAARTSRASSPAVADELVRAAADVLAALPASGEPLALFARRVLGDAHALDVSRPLGRLAVAMVGAAFQPEAADGNGSESARAAWAAAGIELSSVASTVLCLGVFGADPRAPRVSGATATALEAMRAARTPMLLTLDQVRSGGVAALPGRSVVHVCENPTVVQVVAERWAADRPPTTTGDGEGPVLVCTSGQPSTAVLELLERLISGGAGCHYHGDFDWPGLRIARFLGSHIPWTPWRYGAADYREASQGEVPSLGLAGRPAESPWDPELAVVMAERGLAVEEEAVAELLAHEVLAPWAS